MRLAILALAAAAPLFTACGRAPDTAQPPDDEAMVRARCEGKTAEQAAHDWLPGSKDYPKAGNYFEGMDAVAVLQDGYPEFGPIDPVLDHYSEPPGRVLQDPVESEREILGRNTWMMWVGGNEGFWDDLAGSPLGFIDLLKLVDGRNRATRFHKAGLINEPGRTASSAPSEEDFGLWLDQPADEEERTWRRSYLRYAFDLDGSGGPPDPCKKKTPAPARGYGSSPAPAYSEAAGSYDGDNTELYKKIPPPKIYGLSSGVVGLRLFPNPKFDAEARKKWDPKRYYDDPSYYNDPELVRPYRVGMACAFCHASYHPLQPPPDLVNPGWENISGNIGAQYLRIRSVFGNLVHEDNFVYHLLDSQPPGTVDTSLIASDNINNTNTMNSVFGIPERVVMSLRNPSEKLAATSAKQPSLWRHPEADPPPGSDAPPAAFVDLLRGKGLADELERSNDADRLVPRILLDGSDSIGAWGALARVYLNIGTYWEQWNRLHMPVLGFKPQKPFRIDVAEKHSVYWHATQLRVPYLRDYFLKVTPTMPLTQARWPGGRVGPPPDAPARARIDTTKLARGRQVFATNCIVCHSSVQPPEWYEATRKEGEGGELWLHDPGRWLRDEGYLEWAKAAVDTAEFWRENSLSTDLRIPITLVGTNACRAMATNAMTGQMWEDFSSESYRSLPSVGPIAYFNPYLRPKGGRTAFAPRHIAPRGAPPGGGGPGFYRVPTLLSIWATAPLLHNNSLGRFTGDPSIEGRLDAFDDAIRKLLWPERRFDGSGANDATRDRLRRDGGLVWRTSAPSYLYVPAERIPKLVGQFLPVVERVAWLRCLRTFPWLPSAGLFLLAFALLYFARRGWLRALGYGLLAFGLVAGFVAYFVNGKLGPIRIGPIPKGTPVNLLANINPQAGTRELVRAVSETLSAMAQVESAQLSDDETQTLLREKVAPALLRVSRCPDLVMDHGHAFAWFAGMTDDDKEALIELLKTL